MKSLSDLLLEHKDDIVDSWLEQTLASYHTDTALFLKRENNRFANPVGNALRIGIQKIFEALLEDSDFESDFEGVCGQLNEIIKIRAVQDFTPSRAISFVFDLKKIIRSVLKKELRASEVRSDLDAFETRIDQVALFAFDIFVRCREQLYELRVDEVKRSVSTVFKRLERCGSPWDPNLDKSDDGV